MASPSGRKDGLRCGCERLLLEKDPEMGLGVRCGRRECGKFHPLEEINQRAAKFEKQKENPKEEKMGGMILYTLHRDEIDFKIVGAVLARSPREAASILGGEYIKPEGGIKMVAEDPEELNLMGVVRFASELFRNMDGIERQVAGLFSGNKCYSKGGLNLLSPTGGAPLDLTIRQHHIVLPEYVEEKLYFLNN